MKKIILNIAILASFAVFFTACEKEETKIVFDETKAVAPTIKLSATSVKLDANKLTDDAVTFEVSKADYGIQTPIGYSVVITLPASGTEKAKEKVITMAADKLAKKLNVEELNDIFIYDFEKEGGKQYKVSVQAVANPGTNFALKSAAQELTVDTYPF